MTPSGRSSRTPITPRWAIHDAAASADVLHLNDIVGRPFHDVRRRAGGAHHPSSTRAGACPSSTLKYPGIHYVSIAQWLAGREPMPLVHVVHHGIPLTDYTFSDQKDDYVAFLGRMAPCKGPHLAIEAASRAGVRLKLAGEIQPVFRGYWDEQVLPRIDGTQIEYVGEADLADQERPAVTCAGAALPDSVGGAVWPGYDRGDGLRDACAGIRRRRRRRGRPRRRERLDLPRRRRYGRTSCVARHCGRAACREFVDHALFGRVG